MKISDAVAQAKANGHRITENNSNDEFTKSEFYIRIGQDVLNQETDSMDFISLPQPLYLDSMRKNRVSGEGEFQDLLDKGNALLEQLLEEAANQLEPGESKEIPLKVVVCRRKTQVERKPVAMKFKLF